MIGEIRSAAARFFAEAGDYLDTPQHPWLGVSMYLISAMALGGLLGEASHTAALII